MAKPNIVPVPYQNDYRDFLNVKAARNGTVRQVSDTVTVPLATAAGANIGLIPFTKGARFVVNDKSIYIPDIDTGTTSVINIGVIYDTAAEGTDNISAFVAASTIGRTGGFAVVTNQAGNTLVTTGKGWLVVQNTTGTTTIAGDISFSVGVVYDIPTA